MTDKPVVVAICGASGVFCIVRLIKVPAQAGCGIPVELTDGGIMVPAHEMGYDPAK